MKSSTSNSKVLNRSSSCLFDWLSNHRPMIGSRNHLWLFLYMVCWFLFYLLLSAPGWFQFSDVLKSLLQFSHFLINDIDVTRHIFARARILKKGAIVASDPKSNVIYWIASVRAEIICGSLITSVCVPVEFRHLLLYVSSGVRKDFPLVKCNCGVLNCDLNFDCVPYLHIFIVAHCECLASLISLLCACWKTSITFVSLCFNGVEFRCANSGFYASTMSISPWFSFVSEMCYWLKIDHFHEWNRTAMIPTSETQRNLVVNSSIIIITQIQLHLFE
jgi:hypothetical protein